MPEEQFKAAMMRLCDPKIKVLAKEVNKPIFGDNEKIKVNAKFNSNTIRCNLIPQKVVKKKTLVQTEDEKKASAQITRERQFVVQAHIVKVMKAQKTYGYQQVISDVIRNISLFRAEPKMIKE